MIIPVKCFTCGMVLADKYRFYQEEVRKRKYKLDYYLNSFLLLLNDVNNWKTLSIINHNHKKFHWKTVYNEFCRWSKDNIFKIAFEKFINTNYFKHSKVQTKQKVKLIYRRYKNS